MNGLGIVISIKGKFMCVVMFSQPSAGGAMTIYPSSEVVNLNSNPGNSAFESKLSLSPV